MSSKLKSGVFWSVIEVVVKRALDFVVKLILARLLLPESFGVIGMATVFISFIQVFNDAGMGLAIIQKKNLKEKDLNTVFWTNMIWSIFLFLLLSFVAAPIAADFYNEPILIKVVPILSISIITTALNTVHMAQLKRSLSFKKIALANNISSLIAGAIAIGMAFLNFGIWALIANSVIAYIITVPMFYKATKWLPKWEWDKESMKEILSFGLYTTGAKLISNLSSNADYLFIGKLMGASAVGAYTLAYMMTKQVSAQLTTMLDRVMYPFYSSIQDDLEKLKSYYLKMTGNLVLIVYPIMLTLFLFAETLVPLFFGDKWDETIEPLRILTLAIMVDVLTKGYNSLFRSIGMPKYEFKIRRITNLVIYLPLLITGIYLDGIVGAAWAVLTSGSINFFIHTNILKRHFNVRIKDIAHQNYKVWFVCISLFLLVYLLRFFDINEYIVLTVYSIIFTALYFMLFKDHVLKVLRK